jgi:hypothetical protein
MGTIHFIINSIRYNDRIKVTRKKRAFKWRQTNDNIENLNTSELLYQTLIKPIGDL